MQDPGVGPLAPAARTGAGADADTDAAGVSATDPVCGMAVSGTDPALRTVYADVTYAFCSRGCMDRFHEQPDIFTAQPGKGRAANDDRALRADAHKGELQPGQPARLSNAPTGSSG